MHSDLNLFYQVEGRVSLLPVQYGAGASADDNSIVACLEPATVVSAPVNTLGPPTTETVLPAQVGLAPIQNL